MNAPRKEKLHLPVPTPMPDQRSLFLEHVRGLWMRINIGMLQNFIEKGILMPEESACLHLPEKALKRWKLAEHTNFFDSIFCIALPTSISFGEFIILAHKRGPRGLSQRQWGKNWGFLARGDYSLPDLVSK